MEGALCSPFSPMLLSSNSLALPSRLAEEAERLRITPALTVVVSRTAAGAGKRDGIELAGV